MSSSLPRRSQRSGSTQDSIAKTPGDSWSGPLLFPCPQPGEKEWDSRGLVTRLRIKRAKRGMSVQRHRPETPLRESRRQMPVCSKSILPVFPPKKSTSHRSRHIPTGLEDGLCVGFTYFGPEDKAHPKGLLAHKLLKTRGRSQRVLRRSRSPGSMKFTPTTPSPGLYSPYVPPDSPLQVMPLTPLKAGKEGPRLTPEPSDLYTDPSVLAQVKPTRENRRVIYARRERREESDSLTNSLELY